MAHYRIVDHLGEGGMGVVLLARDETLGRNVALKLLSAQFANDLQFRARFMRESRLAAAIDHPNIIPIYEAGEADGQLFIAMRYVAGVDLRELLAAEGPFSTDRAIALVDQMARALDAAHGAGLVHRDVKPGNVLVDRPEGREHCYLTDFGLTKNIASSSGYTETGQFVGTLSYMAPEQIEGGAIDGRADIYALGCLLFECLAGVPPFRRDSDVAMMYAHLREPPPSLCAARADLPPAVDTVMARALAKAPADRHATCLDLVAELQATLAGVPVRPFVPSSAGTGRRFARPPVAPPPPLPSDALTRREPPAPVRPASPPPPPSVPVRRPPRAAGPPPRGRGYMKAAVIVALAVLLTAGGIVAALLLTSRDSGPSAADQQALLDRTKQLKNELAGLKRELQADPGAAQRAGLDRRLAQDQRKADELIAEARRQQAHAAAAAKSLLRANRRFLAGIKALRTYIRTHRGRGITIFITNVGIGTTDVGTAGTLMPDRPGLKPRSPGTPGTGVKSRTVQLPDEAAAAVTAPPGENILTLSGLGDVGGDSSNDFGIVTDSRAYVVFGGQGENVELESLSSDTGVTLPGASALAPVGDVNDDGTADFAASGQSTYLVYGGPDLPSSVDLATFSATGREIQLPSGTEAPVVRQAGDLNDDNSEDVAIVDPNGDGNVQIVFGSASTEPLLLDSLASDHSQGFEIVGDGATGFGSSIAAPGDLDGDSIDDVVVGSPDQNGGVAYVIKGSGQPTEVQVSDLTGKGFEITTSDSSARLGTALAALPATDSGGAGGVLVTAPGSSAAYVVFGGPGFSDRQVEELGSDGYEIRGASNGFGSSAAFAGDVDDDGRSDAIVGASDSANVVFGQESNQALDLRSDTTRTINIVGAAASRGSVPVAGNFDLGGDGHADLLVPSDGSTTASVISGKP